MLQLESFKSCLLKLVPASKLNRKALSKNNLFSETNLGYLPHPAAVRGESKQTAWHTQTAEYYLLLPIYGSSPWCVPQGNLWRTDCVPLVCGPLLLHSWYHVPLVYTCKFCRFSWERGETLSTVCYLSPCEHPTITDTLMIWTVAKSPAKTNYRCLTEINSRYYGLSLKRTLTWGPYGVCYIV